MFDLIFSFVEVSAETPDLNRTRYRALAVQIPLMYGLVIINMIALSFTLMHEAPAYLTILVPALLAPVAIYRSKLILTCDIDALSDQQIQKRLYGIIRFSVLLGPAFIAWALTLFAYGNANSQAQIAFFICLTTMASINCLTHLRQAAVILAVTSLGTTTVYFAIFGTAVFKVIAINMVLVMGAMVIVMLRTSNTFTELVQKQKELSDQSARLELLNAENMRLANLDSLTNLPNRRNFFAELSQLIEQRKTSPRRFVVGILDLSGFKLINDLFGHPAGDQLLMEVGKRLRIKLDDDIILARLGGDQFGLILPEPGSDEMLQLLGNEICNILQIPFPLREGTANIAGSLGFASYPDAGNTAEVLFERADYALCYSKQNSKGKVVLFSSEHETVIREVSTIAHRLREADLGRELSLVYQPIVDSHTGKTVAFEALARWQNPILGSIPPDVFIRSAEQSGMISQLTAILFEKALKAAAAWPDNVQLSFNLSPFDIGSHEHILRLIAMVERSAIPAKRIIFEITETAVMQDFERAKESLRLLHQLGASIALDDFGTGFSSLSYVQRMQIDRLKVDRSFIHNIETDKATQDIVRTVVDLCRNLNLECVIEGIESKQQLTILENMGCNLIQGYYFSKPLNEAGALIFLAREASIHERMIQAS